jgi:hemin uptake protein HemP
LSSDKKIAGSDKGIDKKQFGLLSFNANHSCSVTLPFCLLSLPEVPMSSLPQIENARSEKKASQLPLRRVDVQSLLGADRLLMIEHGIERYFLRITRNNKLILTK